MIRAVLFDFGGVISSSPFEAYAHLEADTGRRPVREHPPSKDGTAYLDHRGFPQAIPLKRRGNREHWADSGGRSNQRRSVAATHAVSLAGDQRGPPALVPSRRQGAPGPRADGESLVASSLVRLVSRPHVVPHAHRWSRHRGRVQLHPAYPGSSLFGRTGAAHPTPVWLGGLLLRRDHEDAVRPRCGAGALRPPCRDGVRRPVPRR